MRINFESLRLSNWLAREMNKMMILLLLCGLSALATARPKGEIFILCPDGHTKTLDRTSVKNGYHRAKTHATVTNGFHRARPPSGPCPETGAGSPPSFCNLPPDVGVCNANAASFYYDRVSRSCQPLSWGGCGGNANRFNTLQECESTCMGVPSSSNLYETRGRDVSKNFGRNDDQSSFIIFEV